MKEIMSLKEACEYFQVTDKTLLNWEQMGLRPVRMSQKLKFYQKDEILRFFEQVKRRKEWEWNTN